MACVPGNLEIYDLGIEGPSAVYVHQIYIAASLISFSFGSN